MTNASLRYLSEITFQQTLSFISDIHNGFDTKPLHEHLVLWQSLIFYSVILHCCLHLYLEIEKDGTALIHMNFLQHKLSMNSDFQCGRNQRYRLLERGNDRKNYNVLEDHLGSVNTQVCRKSLLEMSSADSSNYFSSQAFNKFERFVKKANLRIFSFKNTQAQNSFSLKHFNFFVQNKIKYVY